MPLCPNNSNEPTALSNFIIYHNPRCSKSRQTLALLKENGIEPEIVAYLDQPPHVQELQGILTKLDMDARALLRRGEAVYTELELGRDSLSDQELVQAMISHPILIERPIVVSGDRAVLGRPPENVLELLR